MNPADDTLPLQKKSCQNKRIIRTFVKRFVLTGVPHVREDCVLHQMAMMCLKYDYVNV